jgi:hypothetical protein
MAGTVTMQLQQKQNGNVEEVAKRLFEQGNLAEIVAKVYLEILGHLVALEDRIAALEKKKR